MGRRLGQKSVSPTSLLLTKSEASDGSQTLKNIGLKPKNINRRQAPIENVSLQEELSIHNSSIQQASEYMEYRGFKGNAAPKPARLNLSMLNKPRMSPSVNMKDSFQVKNLGVIDSISSKDARGSLIPPMSFREYNLLLDYPV